MAEPATPGAGTGAFLKLLERDEVLARLRAAAPVALAPRQEIVLAYLYGSVARGRPMPWSDVDVALVLDPPLAPADRLAFELEVELALASASGLHQVEVRVVNDAPILVQGAVVTEGLLVYARDDERRIAYETATRSRYFDFLPDARTMASIFMAALRERLSRQLTATSPVPYGE